MHDLPAFFLDAQPDSVLWLAVRALGFADMRNESAEDAPFSTKARQHYGAALSCMRTMINEGQELGSDHVLYAILLVDNFEACLSCFRLFAPPLMSYAVDVSRTQRSTQPP